MTSQGRHWDVPHRQRYADLITRDVLLQATVGRKSDYKLAEELRVPVAAIQRYRKKWHIKSGCPSRWFGLATAHLREKPIPEDVIGCIVGGVLGDGSLASSPSVNPAFAFLTVEHCIAQREWLEYKKQRLGWLVLMETHVAHRTTTYTPQGSTTCRFSTVNHPTLGELRHLMYDEAGHKRVTKKVLELLTAEGFVWWFFDDGSCSKMQGRAWVDYTLAVSQFTVAEVKLTREMLRRKFGLMTSILRSTNKETGRVYYTLYFAAATRDRLKDILRLLPVKCMQYKIDRSSETTRETPAQAG